MIDVFICNTISIIEYQENTLIFCSIGILHNGHSVNSIPFILIPEQREQIHK